MKQLTTICLLLFSSSSLANQVYDHELVTLMSDEPCSKYIDIIEQPAVTPQTLSEVGMAWGMLVGFDIAVGGLNTQDSTTFEKLKAACNNSPNRSALSLLREIAN